MAKQQPERSEVQKLTPEQQAAEIEDLLSGGKPVDDIVSKYGNLAKGWVHRDPTVKAHAIEAMVLEDYDVDAIVAAYPELEDGVETYAELVTAKEEAAARPPRGGGAMEVVNPEPSRL